MSRVRKRRKRNIDTAELNITAFMNLMVVLVPFLLITAVFSRMAILELNLPAAGKSVASKQKQKFEFQVVVYKNNIAVVDNKGGLLRSIPLYKGKHNTKALTDLLKQIKAKYPDKTNTTILSSPNTSYETLVRVMDSVRTYKAKLDNEFVYAELFPEIAIGDAPVKR
ncbi:MAG: ExbD/TolR family protein [Gammaproteobacteria bacterium]